MKISLIICAHNEEKYISDCLTNAIKNSQGKFHEILVVDNASSDDTVKIAQTFKEVKVISELSKGLTKARQKGLLEAKGDVLAYIDADTHMPVGWIDSLIKNFNKAEDVVCVSGPYVYYDVNIFVKLSVRLYWFLSRITTLFGGYVVVGGNFAAKRESLIQIGGFDSSISFYGEDTDIARRLHKVGRIIFSSSMVMYTSARRFHGEGVVKTGVTYALNYFSIHLRGKPMTHDYNDIR